MDKLEIYNEREKKSFTIDLKPDNSVSLQLKSNLFSAIDKITLNHSFTITAPDTLQNRRAFGVGNQVASDSDRVRMKYPCKFYRNGVQLFNGTCLVQSIESNSFSLLLTWGLDVLEALKDGGDLQDLDLGNMRFYPDNFNTEGKPVPDYNTYAEAMKEHMFFAHSVGDFMEWNDYYVSGSNQFTPCIAARTLFKQCLESAGISYEVDDAAFEFMKRLAIPLPTLDSGELEIPISGVGVIGAEDGKIGNTSYYDGAYFITGFVSELANLSIVDGARFTVASSCDMKLSYSVTIGADDLFGSQRLMLCVVQYDDKGKETSRTYKRVEIAKTEYKGADIVYYFDDVEIDLDANGEFYFVILGSTSKLKGLSVRKLIAEFTEPPIVPGLELSIAANLPKISKINYVKALCQICGIFPIPPVSNSNFVRFVAPGILEANKPNAVDWSGFVNGEPKKIAFAFSDFAQKNLIMYKNGEEYAASFPMESPTADKEKTAFELPFMHLKGGRWPLWSVEREEIKDKDGKVIGFDYPISRESVDPAIYCLRPSGGDENTDAYLSFDELTPAAILKRWKPLTDAVKRAKVVQVELMLPFLELKYVDYSVPVYIEQLGGYFGIVSLNNSGNKTTAELIKI